MNKRNILIVHLLFISFLGNITIELMLIGNGIINLSENLSVFFPYKLQISPKCDILFLESFIIGASVKKAAGT